MILTNGLHSSERKKSILHSVYYRDDRNPRLRHIETLGPVVRTRSRTHVNMLPSFLDTFPVV
jgi:hypothetical protein